MKTLLSIFTLALLGSTLTGTLYGQDITGDWQGTLKIGRELRLIARISKQLDGSLQVRVLAADQNPPDWGSGNLANTVSLEGTDFRFTVDALKASYEGKLSADGNSITGTFSQGKSVPLDLSRATKETAWRDPAPHTDQFITVDKDVRLEVLDWGGSGPPLVLLSGMGNTAHIFDRFAPKLIDQFHGLVYLDAAYAYAIHDPAQSSCTLPPVPATGNPKTVSAAIQAGTQKYTVIKSPALAIYAAPKEGAPADDAALRREACAKAFEKGVPSGRIVRLPGATHYLFISNEAEVLKEIRDFIGDLKS